MAQMKAFFAACNDMIKKGAEEDEGMSSLSHLHPLINNNRVLLGFGVSSPTTSTTQKAAAGMRRAGTIVRSPLEARRDKKDRNDGDTRAADVSIFSLAR